MGLKDVLAAKKQSCAVALPSKRNNATFNELGKDNRNHSGNLNATIDLKPLLNKDLHCNTARNNNATGQKIVTQPAQLEAISCLASCTGNTPPHQTMGYVSPKPMSITHQPQISEAVLLDKQQRWLRHLVGCEVCTKQWGKHLRLGLTSKNLPYCSLQASQYAYFVMAIWSSTPDGIARLEAFSRAVGIGRWLGVQQGLEALAGYYWQKHEGQKPLRVN